MQKIILSSLLFLAIGLLGCASGQSSRAGVISIESDLGGSVGDYVLRVSDAKKRGDRVEILGNCYSACTLWTSMPADKICVGRHAILGFHSTNVPATNGVLMATYPEPIKRWITKWGGLTERILILDGEELRSMFQQCS